MALVWDLKTTLFVLFPTARSVFFCSALSLSSFYPLILNTGSSTAWGQMLVNQKALTHRSTSRAKLPCSSQCEIPWEPDYVLGLPARNRKGKARNINIEDARKFPVPCQRVHSFGSLESKAHTVTFHGASPFCTQSTKEIIYIWKQVKITNAELWARPRGCETKGELISLRIKVKHYNCFGPEIKQPMTTSGNVRENFILPTSCYTQ